MAKKVKKQSKEKIQREPMSPEKKAVILTVSGILVACVALIITLACTSYLFTWKADQSLLSNPEMMSPDVDVHNIIGKLGYRQATFFVEKSFGLCYLVVMAYLFAAAYYLVSKKKPEKLARKTLITLSGAVLGSAILSYIGTLCNAQTAFSGGLGGYIGTGLVTSMNNLIGTIGTAVALVFLTILWLVFTNRRFAMWLAAAFDRKPKPAEEPVEEPAAEQEAQEAEVLTPEDVEPIQPFGNVDVEPEGPSDVFEEDELFGAAVPAAVQSSVDTPVEDDAEEVVGLPEADDSLTIVEGQDFTEDVSELERIDVKAELENFKFPSVDLLDDYSDKIKSVTRLEVETNNDRIRTTLESYKIQVDTVTAIVGPTVTLYKVKLALGVKSALVRSVEKDIAMALGNDSVRVTYLSDAVGIEVANETKSIVPLKAMFNDNAFRESKAELPIALGYTIEQKVKTFDLADAPHLLVAGATKQGKSVGLNVIVTSLLYSKHPSELKFVFVDPKMVEFTPYKRLLKHYLAAMPTSADAQEEADNVIVKDHVKADEILRSLCIEMDDRYLLLSKAGVNKLKDYNEKYSNRYLRPDQGHRYLPYLVVVIDEYADLIMAAASGAKSTSKSVTASIIRLAQKGRAAGIHVIIATQRPTVDVITGLIKANFPTRIAFRVISRTDSGTILDSPGAEKLIGRGDMLYYEGIKMERVQCAYIDTKEIDAVTKFIEKQDGYRQHYNTPYYLPELPADPAEGEGGSSAMIDMHKLDANFEEAARLVVTYQKGSTSDIQRRLGMGYARAGKVMDQLEAAGVVGPQEGSKPRAVLVQSLDELQPILDAFLTK